MSPIAPLGSTLHGVNFSTSPTVRLSIRYFMIALTYAAYVVLDDPANTAHMINLGYAFEF